MESNSSGAVVNPQPSSRQQPQNDLATAMSADENDHMKGEVLTVLSIAFMYNINFMNMPLRSLAAASVRHTCSKPMYERAGYLPTMHHLYTA
jgi:hypothetical protein